MHLSWVDKLVENIKTIFIDLYADQIKKPHTTKVDCRNFDEYFDQQYRELEASGSTNASIPVEPDTTSGNLNDEPPPLPGLKHRGKILNGSQGLTSTAESTPVATPNTSRPSTPSGNHLALPKGVPMGKMSRRAKKLQNSSSARVSSGDEAPSRKAKKAPKKNRKWDADGFADEEDDTLQLDYSATQNTLTSDSEAEATARSTAIEGVDSSTWGTTTSKGQFVLKDLGDEVHSILKAAEQKNTASDAGTTGSLVGLGLNTISSLFRNVVGGKTLTKADLEKTMAGMEDHLLRKNVAREAALRLCAGVEKELIGVKTDSFESIDKRITRAMEASLTKMLTPTSSLDLLHDIDSVTKPSTTSTRKPRPYVISIVGVNGVGKSTNLSKICYFLLQNRYKVLIAAGDTFRSGAVEQLKVHVRNLKELAAREGGQVDIFEKGYGGDAATVARDAVREATNEGFDVVLIDTAGRRHNDKRLMSSLEKFARLAQPDKILMVGEVRFSWIIS